MKHESSSCALLALSLCACLMLGCLLADVGIDGALEPGGTGGGPGTGVGSLRGSAEGAGETCRSTTDRESACIDYCGIYTSVCEDHPANDYDGLLDCTNFCIDSNWPIGTAPTQAGSIACRCVHAGLAETLGLDPHCYHSARVPSRGQCEL